MIHMFAAMIEEFDQVPKISRPGNGAKLASPHAGQQPERKAET
jgi:hypothetical protein